MASEGSASAPPAGPTTDRSEGANRDGYRGGRGRGRGRGQGHGRGRGGGGGGGAGFPDAQHDNEGDGRPPGGGGYQRRGGAGHRGRGHASSHHHQHQQQHPQQPQTIVATDGSSSVNPLKKGTPRIEKVADGSGESGKEGEETKGDDVEAEVCFICASDVEHMSVAPCNHRTCHICALRMRALYKTNDCAHCRTKAEYVIFTDNATKHYEDFSPADIASADTNIGIRYENNEIREDTLLLLRYNCPDADCDVACMGWPDLHRHVRTVHHKKICDLCSRHKKVFTHEHELFTDKELEKHMKKGDDNPGAIDQSGFKGHPLCGFCGQRFYGEDELYVHCRDKHERCFICDRRGGPPTYYVNYESLVKHYGKDHFPCLDRECLEKKFIVFPTEMDLKAHQLADHGNTLSKDVRRDARVVDISSFDYRTPYVQERRGGGSQREQREARGRGRGRDPNAEAIPASSAQPLRRDEQAFQRQIAIHSAQSVAPRTFGGQLTPAAPTPARTPGPASQTVRPSPNVENNLSAGVSNIDISQADLTPADQARQLRHRGVIDRATNLLNNDPTKLTHFRNTISFYKTNSMTATALIDSFFGLFSDTSSTALGTLIREVADLYEDRSKADNLRTAWNDWRAINEDYPSLPGPSDMSSTTLPGMGWATVTSASTSQSSTGAPSKAKSNRVLKLKSSTAQSSRSQVSQSGSWGGPSLPTVSRSTPSASTSNAFPELPGPSNRASASTKITTVPWAPSSAPASNPGSARPTPPTSRPVSRGPPRGGTSADMFPALPPAAKPQSTIFGYGTGMVRRDGLGGASSSSGFSWGGAGNAGSANASEGETAGDEGKKRKGNKGKKQVLINWG